MGKNLLLCRNEFAVSPAELVLGESLSLACQNLVNEVQGVAIDIP